ncbi:hypothetical protein HanRHA438_Chr08g0366761 [Helianthus annuus]|uniref:Transmembrane protein n=1 Tax=Helianthus annuus TaxID=4232 RepID=A0A251U885_HELAN|nr:hypothetical protein HanXRQr2_Chr08g0354671 [Helianthus annuus]KAJ0539965.1 hypothetical protein HanHA300_Chr08g0292751 [Helianthus annuus]KAJ0554705.1 hypothetical protein HanHA89_Chr08g0311231 [Helianthus annuus]KAJ0720269.1 hypothetical protein HanLR1_Chr08g0291541 [Helianthus annuus]KAJ0723485.1 hypothetical protein HanOQP8_Chr08g0298911 [Helianthus annuus]
MKNVHMETQSILNQSAEIPQSSSTRFSIILSFLFCFFLPFSFICFLYVQSNPFFTFSAIKVGKAGGAKRIERPDSASHTSLDLIREISF